MFSSPSKEPARVQLEFLGSIKIKVKVWSVAESNVRQLPINWNSFAPQLPTVSWKGPRVTLAGSPEMNSVFNNGFLYTPTSI